MYLFIKEAINNLVKHSDCQRAEISITKKNHHILLTIIDDGIGFDPETVYASNGIRTMQLRASQLQGKLTINSRNQLKKGTHITLEFPIT
jgi:signal transduction histidine kinase